MEARMENLTFGITFLSLLLTAFAFFDIEELKSFNYGIDIRSEPVVMKAEADESDTSTVQLSSKYGQPYQCNFPNTVEQEKQKEEAEKVAMETGIPDLLKPMETAPCLGKTKDWWSYEFCYGKTIKQFHLAEDGTMEGEIISLGIYESEDDWDETEDLSVEERRESRLKRYHTQNYVNGSKCDLNGKLRKTEVRFICEEGAADYIHRVDEPETCSYIMTVHTMRICHHPLLKSPTPTRTVTITCHPLLTVLQYQDYLDQLEAKEEKERLEEEKRQAALEEKKRLALEKAKYFEQNNQATQDGEEDGEVEVEGETDMDTGDVDTATAETRATGMLKPGQDGSQKVQTVVKFVDDPKDMETFLDEAMKEVLKLKAEADDDAMFTDQTPAWTKVDAVRHEPPQIPKERQPTYLSQEELDELGEKEEERRRKEREETEEEEEVEEEADPDLEEFDSEIKTLKERYQDRRDKLSALKNKVRSSMEKQYQAIIKEAQEELAEDGEEPVVDQKEAVRHLTKTIDSLLKQLDKTEKEIEEVDKELEQFAEYDPEHKTDKTPPVKQAEGPSKMDLDNRVKVRVSKLKPGAMRRLGDDDIATSQTERLERSVQRELEKAGVGEGGKIQVKIITTGYYDKDDETLHVLTEEESETFKNMIVTLIGGTVDADNEEAKHSQLEENYSFVWGKEPASDSAVSDTGTQTHSEEQPDAQTGTQTDTQTDTQTESEDDQGT